MKSYPQYERVEKNVIVDTELYAMSGNVLRFRSQRIEGKYLVELGRLVIKF